MKKYFLSILSVLILSFPVFAEKMKIAVMDFKAQGVNQTLTLNVSELIRNEMIQSGKFIVIERSQMGIVLKEQGFQQSGCTDITCAVEIGKILSAKKILIGTTMKMGTMIVITARIVDVKSGTAEYSEKQNAKSEDDLYNAATIFTKKLLKNIDGNAGDEEEENTEEVAKAGEPAEEQAPAEEEAYPGAKPYRHLIGTNGAFSYGKGKKKWLRNGADINENISEKGGDLSAAYTFFFSPVGGNGLPNDLRELILCPSKIYGSAGMGKLNRKDSVSAEIESIGFVFEPDNTSKYDWIFYNAGGEYYFPSRTGIIASYTYQSIDFSFEQKETSMTQNRTIEEKPKNNILLLGLNQNFGNVHRIYLNFEMNKLKGSDYKNENQTLTLGWIKATGTTGSRFVLNLETSGGKTTLNGDDYSNFLQASIIFGPAFSNFAIYFDFDLGVEKSNKSKVNTEVTSTDVEASTDFKAYNFAFGVKPVYWINGWIGVGLNSKAEARTAKSNGVSDYKGEMLNYLFDLSIDIRL